MLDSLALADEIDGGKEQELVFVVLCSGGGQIAGAEAVKVRRQLKQIRAINADVVVAVLSGREILDRVKEVLASLLSALDPADPSAKPRPASASPEPLTPQQLRVAHALRKGLPNKLIAHQLNISESTVKAHVRSIMKEIKAKNRTEVAFLTNRFFSAEDNGCGGA